MSRSETSATTTPTARLGTRLNSEWDGPVLREVCAEAEAAEARYGSFTSTHEAFGVLSEEVAELLQAIRANALESVRTEAIQVAAVALPLAEGCREYPAFAARSGGKS